MLITRKNFVSVLTVLLISVLVFAHAPEAVYCDSPWHTKEYHVTYFKDLCDAHPSQTSYESVGKTYNGKDIMMFKIGNPNGGRVLWDAQLHGNEHYGSEILDLIGEWLFSDDPYATQILQNNYVLIIPVVNLDSYDRSNANHEQCRYGVDLNRNFETGWSGTSCSSSQTYSGPYPASEKETQTLRNVFETYEPMFYVNLHQGASSAPFYSYYRGGNSTLANQVKTRATEVAGELGTTIWRVGQMGSTGFAIGDAYTVGDVPSSWLIEVDPRWTHTNSIWQDLVNEMYPKCLATFIAMCEISAGQTFQEPPPSYYNLEIRSSPISNVRFTIDGQIETTPYSENLEQGRYTVVMPESVSVSSETYIFDQWQDASTSLARTIYLTADTTVTASYELVGAPHAGIPQLFGWGGVFYGGTSGYSAVEPMLDEMQADGWNCYRYYSVPTWAQPRWGTSGIDYNVLSHLCDEATERGMYIFLNIAHNFPTGAYIDGHRDEWINGYLADLDGINAKNRDNIILELANEYAGSQRNVIAHYNALIAALRAEGYTQTIQLNYWWDHDIAYCVSQIDDPLNNFMAGMHHYAQSKDFDDYNTPGTFTEVCQNSGIEDYLQNSIWPNIIKPVLDAGVDYCCSELGTGWDYKYTRGGVAFCMRFLQLAEEKGRVHAIMHRWQPGGPSYETDYDDYYEMAQKYFGMSFFQEPPAPPPTSIFDDGFESGDFSEWSGTRTSSGATASVVDTLPHHGSFSGRFTSNGEGEVEYAYCYRTIDEEEVYARGYFYVASGLPLDNNDDRFYFITFRSGQNHLAAVGIRRHEGSDKWVLYGMNGSGWVDPFYSMSPAIEMNRWYCVELHWKKHATHGVLEAFVDDERILLIEDIDTVGLGNVSEINFGLALARQVQKKLDVYGDCFAFSDVYVGSYALSDVNHDGSVNILDLSIVSWSFGSVPDDPRWNPDADLNKDGIINILDMVIVAKNFGS